MLLVSSFFSTLALEDPYWYILSLKPIVISLFKILFKEKEICCSIATLQIALLYIFLSPPLLSLTLIRIMNITWKSCRKCLMNCFHLFYPIRYNFTPDESWEALLQLVLEFSVRKILRIQIHFSLRVFHSVLSF